MKRPPHDTSLEPPDKGSAARESRTALTRLRGLATRLDHQASLIRNGGFNPQAEAEAGRLAGEAFAIRWALRQIAPETEQLGQVFANLRSLNRKH